MFEKIERTAVAEFDLLAMGPVLVASGVSNKADPTLPDCTFLSGRYGDGNNLTYIIPGSTVKGVIRKDCADFVNEIQLFGTVDAVSQKSKICFHDAYAEPETVVFSIKHSTAIDAHAQTAKGGSLNNMQVIEKGVFKAGFRLTNFTDDELYAVLNSLSRVNMGAVRFGGRKSRGFGFMNVANFKLSVSEGLNADFTIKGEKSYESLDDAVYSYGKEC